MTLHVYKVETGCTYHIAAPNMGALLQVILDEFPGCDPDFLAENDQDLEILQLKREEWPKTYNDSEGSGDPRASFADLVARTTKAGILTGSEWP